MSEVIAGKLKAAVSTGAGVGVGGAADLVAGAGVAGAGVAGAGAVTAAVILMLAGPMLDKILVPMPSAASTSPEEKLIAAVPIFIA